MLYIKDIPVIWLPFIFSDTRAGRHSGMLPPKFGFGDIVRNSPTYRRHVDHFGYYWALSDYYDFATWLDWRSSAGATQKRSRLAALNGDWNYRWMNRFMGGRVGLSYTTQRDGSTNPAVSWGHQQEFSNDSRLNTNVNYVTNTTLQRQNTFNPVYGARHDRVAGDLSDEIRPGVAQPRRDAHAVSRPQAGRPERCPRSA